MPFYRQYNEYKEENGVTIVDISTKKFPKTFMLIDTPDWEYLLEIGAGRVSPSLRGKYVYAQTCIALKQFNVHSLLFPFAVCIDHKNHNTLDNRRSNLRACSFVDNIRNQKRRKDNTSGRRGVSFCRKRKKWRAYITIEKGKQKNLGVFLLKEEAVAAREMAEKKYFGEFNYNEKNQASPKISKAFSRLVYK